MFKRREKQSLLEARSKSLERAEKLIKDLNKKTNIIAKNNIRIQEQNNKKTNLFNNIIKEIYSNVKTDKQKVAKIKELISDYQSEN